MAAGHATMADLLSKPSMTALIHRAQQEDEGHGLVAWEGLHIRPCSADAGDMYGVAVSCVCLMTRVSKGFLVYLQMHGCDGSSGAGSFAGS